MRRRECPPPRIKRTKAISCQLRKRVGSIQWVTGFFFLLFLTLLLCVQVQVDVYRASSLYLEDALAASNLASAVIDIEEYGISHTIRIADVAEAYERYQVAVKENLELDDNWECGNPTLISGKVTIEEYVVYNVEQERVNTFCISKEGNISKTSGALGEVKAPNGIIVEATSVYSEISFPVKGILGITTQAHKGKLADIVSVHTDK